MKEFQGQSSTNKLTILSAQSTLSVPMYNKFHQEPDYCQVSNQEEQENNHE